MKIDIDITDDVFVNCPLQGKNGYDLIRYKGNCGEDCEHFKGLIGLFDPKTKDPNEADLTREFRIECGCPVSRRMTRIKL